MHSPTARHLPPLQTPDNLRSWDYPLPGPAPSLPSSNSPALSIASQPPNYRLSNHASSPSSGAAMAYPVPAYSPLPHPAPRKRPASAELHPPHTPQRPRLSYHMLSPTEPRYALTPRASVSSASSSSGTSLPPLTALFGNDNFLTHIDANITNGTRTPYGSRPHHQQQQPHPMRPVHTHPPSPPQSTTSSVSISSSSISGPTVATTTPQSGHVTSRDTLGPRIWTGSYFLPRFVREAEVPGEGLCYFYDDNSHCRAFIDGEPVTKIWGVTKAGKPRKRLAIACLTCREKKIKCDPDFPACVQCSKFGRTCRFKNAPRGGVPGDATNSSSTEYFEEDSESSYAPPPPPSHSHSHAPVPPQSAAPPAPSNYNHNSPAYYSRPPVQQPLHHALPPSNLHSSGPRYYPAVGPGPYRP